MRAIPTILCRACGGAGTLARSLSMHAGLGGAAALATGPCAACQGARWEPDPRALERFAQALADVYACVLAEAPWPRCPSPWWDVCDAVLALTHAARVRTRLSEGPSAPAVASARVRGAVAALDALLVPAVGEADARARLFAAAWDLLSESVARLPSAGVEAVATTRPEGSA